jgi:hypothetical protein
MTLFLNPELAQIVEPADEQGKVMALDNAKVLQVGE